MEVVPGAVAALCLVLTGCSCGALVRDSSRTVDDGGAPHHQQTGGAGGMPSTPDGGVPAEVDAGEDLIEPRSGSIVQVGGISAEDGHRAIVNSVRDRVHGVECAITRAADGTSRCLPADRSLSIRYADPGCHQPLAYRSSSPDSCTAEAPEGTFAIEDPSVRCPDPGATVFAVGAIVPVPDEIYYSSPFGCELLADSPTPGELYFAASPLPPGDWVAFEHHVKKVTDRLGVGYWTGSDGARLLDSAWLLEDDAPCRLEMDVAGNQRCIPSRRAAVDYNFYTDDTCTTHAAVTVLCDTPDLVETDGAAQSSGCLQPTIFGILHTASPIDSTLVYSGNPDACVPTKYGGFKYYAPRDVVRFDSFPSIERMPEGEGRLQPLYWASEGKHLYVDGLYDSLLGARCTPARTATGTACQTDFTTNGLGAYGAYGAYYADATCTVPLFGLPSAPECSSFVPQYVPEIPGGVAFGCGLPPAYPVRRVLEAHVGPVYNGRFTGQFPAGPSICSRDSSSPGAVTYDVGPLLEPARVFAPLTTTNF